MIYSFTYLFIQLSLQSLLQSKSELVGRTTIRPHVRPANETYVSDGYVPQLQWYQIYIGNKITGEILVTAELLEVRFYIGKLMVILWKYIKLTKYYWLMCDVIFSYLTLSRDQNYFKLPNLKYQYLDCQKKLNQKLSSTGKKKKLYWMIITESKF